MSRLCCVLAAALLRAAGLRRVLRLLGFTFGAAVGRWAAPVVLCGLHCFAFAPSLLSVLLPWVLCFVGGCRCNAVSGGGGGLLLATHGLMRHVACGVSLVVVALLSGPCQFHLGCWVLWLAVPCLPCSPAWLLHWVMTVAICWWLRAWLPHAPLPACVVSVVLPIAAASFVAM